MTFNNSAWDESKHPRDDIGRFTFKNGGIEEKGIIEHNPAHILYGLSKDKEDKVKYRNKLINMLGDKLTPAEILYAKTDELEEKLKEIIPHNNKAMAAAKLGDDEDNKSDMPTEEFQKSTWKSNNSTYIQNEYMGYKNKSASIDYKPDNREMSDYAVNKARILIQGEEKFKPNAYKDSGGVWTIGYGHTKGVKAGDKITKEEAEKLYREDLRIHSESLKRVKVPLSENQKAALSSLVYNIGDGAFRDSNLLIKLNKGDIIGAAKEFATTHIRDRKGVVQQGLIDRRKKEKELFLTPDK